MDASPDANSVRRGLILGEISQLPNITNPSPTNNESTPKSSSPDEMVIQQRGPRVIPATWSPVDCSKFNILEQSSRQKTPEKIPVRDMKPGLRRRLTLSPVKYSAVNETVMKRIKSLNYK